MKGSAIANFTIRRNNHGSQKLTTQTEKAVLIDFWASWCGPCMKLAPELEKLAEAHPEIIVGKVEVTSDQENISIAASLGVNNIPAMFFYKDGKLAQRLIGYMTAEELEAKLGL